MAHYRKLMVGGQKYHWVVATDYLGFTGAYVRELKKVIPGYQLEEMTAEQYEAIFGCGDPDDFYEFCEPASVTPLKVSKAIRRNIT